MLGFPDGWGQLNHNEISRAQTFTLSFLVLSEMFMAVSYRSKDYVFKIGLFSNRFFVVSFFAVIAAHLAILYIPFLNTLFETTPLSILDWVIILLMSGIMFAFFELSKRSPKVVLEKDKQK